MSYAKTTKPEPMRKVTRLAEVTAATIDAAETTTAEVKTAAQGMQTKMTHAARTVFDTQREAVATMMQAGKIYSAGLQALAAHAAHVNKVHFDETVTALRTLATTRSVTEAMRVQTELARNTANRAMTETTRMMQDYLKVTEQAVAPLTAKLHEATQKFAKAA